MEPDGSEPCGRCLSCTQVSRLSHPDVHWFVPFPPSPKKAADAEKQVADAADAIEEILAERRVQPLYGPPEPTASHPVASTRLLQKRVALRPFQGPNRVIILGNAERLVVQEASQEAANALLKILEEPPPGTYLILTSPSPQSLLPTIRSRLVPVRVPPVTDAAAIQFGMEQLGLSEKTARQRVEGAGGSIGVLVATSSKKDRLAAASDRLLKAVKRGPTEWAAIALAQPPWGARAEFTELLDAAALRLRRQIIRQAEDDHAGAARPLEAIRIIHEFRDGALRNVNPQLGMALLAQRLGQI